MGLEQDWQMGKGRDSWNYGLFERSSVNLRQYKLAKIYTYVKVVEMKSPNNRRDRIPPGHLSSSDEASTTRNGLHLIKLLAEGGAGAGGLGRDGTGLIVWPYCEHNICITQWTRRSRAGAYLESAALGNSAQGTGRSSAGYQREKVNRYLAASPLSTVVSCLRTHWGNAGTKVVGIASSLSEWT